MTRLCAQVVREWGRTRAWIFGAGLAFYAVIAIIPTLLFLLLTVGMFLGQGPAYDTLAQYARACFGDREAGVLLRMLHELMGKEAGRLSTVVGVVTVVFGVTQLGVHVRSAFDVIWEWRGPKGSTLLSWLTGRLVGLAMALCVSVALAALPFLSALFGAVRAVLEHYFGWGVVSLHTLHIMKLIDFGGSAFLVVVIFFVIYRFIPRAKVRSQEALLGAVVAAMAFIAGKSAVAPLLAGSLYASLYGFAGSFMIMLLWIYFTAQVLLLGALTARGWQKVAGETR
ncbi:MAG: YihY/virulence factor BrkB family protein [Synergistales bacterium]|nr:YihY/virulence factor BrkB family protein [Synergistales bacterium]